ncbi:MAG: glycosyltransferase [Flavobacteriales bacterium]|nr:glycosyltransferase [Flavobacteriales bacterium]
MTSPWFLLLAFVPLAWHGWQISGWSHRFKTAWSRTDSGKVSPPVLTAYCDNITVVLPVRNEVVNLPNLLLDLAAGRQLPAGVIIVDDASEDGTLDAVQQLTTLPFPVRTMANPGRGKKPGLSTGIRATQTTWVVQVDADVRMGHDFISAIAERLASTGEQTDMMLLPLRLADCAGRAPNKRFARLQALDFAAMQGWAVAAVQRQRPAMASGGAWVWRSSAFPHDELKPELASGDDVFALSALIKRGDARRVGWCGDPRAMASAGTMPDLQSLLDQRIRWGAKSAAYPRSLSEARRVASVVAAVHVFGLVLLCLNPLAGGVYWTIKSGIDMAYTHQVGTAYGLFDGLSRLQRAQDLLLLAFVHPLFIITTLILMPFRKAQWKGRATG